MLGRLGYMDTNLHSVISSLAIISLRTAQVAVAVSAITGVARGTNCSDLTKPGISWPKRSTPKLE